VTGAFLHRYCPDHNPHRALCGLPLVGAEEVAEKDLATDRRPACVVCGDLSAAACEDACLSARTEPAT
jgi:hypothetical protein